MAGYRLVSYSADKGARCGVVVGEEVFDIGQVPGGSGYATTLDVLNDWDKAKPALEKFAASGSRSGGKAFSSVSLLAPVLYPFNIYCAGNNYHDHVAEMARNNGREPEADPHTMGLKPWHFIKVTRALVGPGTIAIPAETKALDWEGEMTAVIGRVAKNVSIEKALDYVAGYSVSCDLSARDLSHRVGLPPTSPFSFDWIGQKSFDGSCPTGPWIVPADEIGDPQKIDIKLWVNGVIKQDSNTNNMIYTLAEQISHLSSRITLYPGDIILTGSPAGVGHPHKTYLKPGDKVKITMEKIGTLDFSLS